MDAMGLSNKKPSTVSTSHSGSFAPNNPDLAKAAGIVSACPGPQLSRPPVSCSLRVPHPGLQTLSSHCSPGGSRAQAVRCVAAMRPSTPPGPLFRCDFGSALGQPLYHIPY